MYNWNHTNMEIVALCFDRVFFQKCTARNWQTCSDLSLLLFVKEAAEATAAAAAEAAGARAAKPVAPRAELEGEEIKRLPEGVAWRCGGAGRRGLRAVGDRMVPAGHHHGKGGGGGWRGRPTSPSPPVCGLGGGTAKWPNVAEGETAAAFFCLFGMSDPPERKNYFLLRLCFVDEASGEYTGRDVWQKLHGGGGHPPGGGV